MLRVTGTSIGCLSCAPNWGPTHNAGMCPDQESNLQPFCLQAVTQYIEPHRPGPQLFLLQALFYFLLHSNFGPCLQTLDCTHIITLTLNITGSSTIDLGEVELIQIILHSLTSPAGKILQEAICGRIAVVPGYLLCVSSYAHVSSLVRSPTLPYFLAK